MSVEVDIPVSFNEVSLSQSSKKTGNSFVIFLAGFATIGGFLFGYDIGVIGGVKDMDTFRLVFDMPLRANCSLNSSLQTDELRADCRHVEITLGWIVGSFSLGCFGGALIAGVMSDKLGRRKTIISGGLMFVVGGSVQSAAVQIWMVFVGRVIAGVGVGVMSMVVPVYNAEVSPKDIRGRLVSLQQLSITAGIMVSFIVNLGCVHFEIGWRISLGLQCVFAIILILGMIVLPESPRWLVKQGFNSQAQCVLQQLRITRKSAKSDEIPSVVLDELQDIQEAVEMDKKMKPATWRELLGPKLRKRMFVGFFIQLFQQYTGMNVIMYYSTTLFGLIHVSEYVATALTGVINFLATIAAVYLVDYAGRKVLLLCGSLGMAASVFLAAALLSPYTCSEGVDQTIGYIVTFLVCLFVINFAYGWGATAWVVTSEIFPLRIREKAVSVTTSANWISNFSIAMCTPLLLDCDVLGVRGTFFLMGVFLTLSYIFVLFTTPETKGKSLEHIDDLFTGRSWSEMSRWNYYLKCGCPWKVCRQREYSVIEKLPLVAETPRTDESEVTDTSSNDVSV
ncbi:glucose transporter GlcP-like [Corticium candelabrum]|uniref:glucose transporter GlcP-like n=1 Tax=Corticium candelabrum TaxID=121492 RepID=UPI002E25CFF9|nr:glucose transporter GlcP-like [Corticium candelabrum]